MMKVKRSQAREVKRFQAQDIEGQDLHTEEKSDHKKKIEDASKVFNRKKKIVRLVEQIQVPTDLILHIRIRVQVDLKLQMRAGVAMALKKNLQI